MSGRVQSVIIYKLLQPSFERDPETKNTSDTDPKLLKDQSATRFHTTSRATGSSTSNTDDRHNERH